MVIPRPPARSVGTPPRRRARARQRRRRWFWVTRRIDARRLDSHSLPVTGSTVRPRISWHHVLRCNGYSSLCRNLCVTVWFPLQPSLSLFTVWFALVHHFTPNIILLLSYFNAATSLWTISKEFQLNTTHVRWRPSSVAPRP